MLTELRRRPGREETWIFSGFLLQEWRDFSSIQISYRHEHLNFVDLSRLVKDKFLLPDCWSGRTCNRELEESITSKIFGCPQIELFAWLVCKHIIRPA